MLDQSQLMAALQQIMQKTRATDQQVSSLAPAPAPLQYQRPMPAISESAPISKNGDSTLGFLGGLGDTTNAVTGVADPSIITKLNQYIMSTASRLSGQPINLPWQQTSAQNSGQALAKMLGL